MSRHAAVKAASAPGTAARLNVDEVQNVNPSPPWPSGDDGAESNFLSVEYRVIGDLHDEHGISVDFTGPRGVDLCAIHAQP